MLYKFVYLIRIKDLYHVNSLNRPEFKIKIVEHICEEKNN